MKKLRMPTYNVGDAVISESFDNLEYMLDNGNPEIALINNVYGYDFDSDEYVYIILFSNGSSDYYHENELELFAPIYDRKKKGRLELPAPLFKKGDSVKIKGVDSLGTIVATNFFTFGTGQYLYNVCFNEDEDDADCFEESDLQSSL